MKTSKKWIVVLTTIIIILIIVLLVNNSKSSLNPQSTQYTSNDEKNSALESQYNESLVRLDELTTYVNSIQTDKFQDVKPVSIINTLDENSCSFSGMRPLSSLNSGSDKFFYLIDNSKKLNASFLSLAKVDLARNEKIGIMDYIEYKDTVCNNAGVKSNVRLAAGVRLELDIKESNNKISATTPSQIAAAMELNIAKVTYHIRTIGFKTDSTRKILSNIEEQGDFNVKSYVRVIDALNKIMASMNDTLQVNPEIVPY